MPEISRFLGIVIRMFVKEHNPPHFHAFYGDYVGVISIETGQIIAGELPNKQTALVTAWTILYKEELMQNWNKLIVGEKAKKINPLKK